MKNQKSKSLISLSDEFLIKANKESLDIVTLELLNKIRDNSNFLEQLALLKKFEYIIDGLKDSILKEDTINAVFENTEGTYNQAVTVNSVVFTVTQRKEFDYSDCPEVTKLQTDIKNYQADLDAEKKKARNNQTAKLITVKSVLRRVIQ